MSYENPSFYMRAENVGHNVQKIYLGCCNCKKQIEQLRKEASMVREAQLENRKLLLDIKAALVCAHQERVKLQETLAASVIASASVASVSASADGKITPKLL
jgi:PIN domain nuclease of toxin-antitoxin system